MRALVVGVDGKIGQALTSALDARGIAWHGTSRRPGNSSQVRFLDLEQPIDLGDLGDVDVAYLCAALTGQVRCSADPQRARRINVDAPLAIGRILRRHGARTVLLSSNAVFDGSRSWRTEDEPVSPETEYGRTKAEAERGLLDLGNTTVLRLTKVLSDDNALIKGWIRSLVTGETIKPFHDARIAPIGLGEVVDALVALGKAPVDGIFHQSGARDLPYADIAYHVVARLGADPRLVQPWSRAEAGMAEADWRLTCLATTRLSQLTGFEPPGALDVIDRVFGLVPGTGADAQRAAP